MKPISYSFFALMLVSLVSCSLMPDDAKCELPDDDFALLSQRIVEFLIREHPNVDAACSKFTNKPIYSERDGCLIPESWQQPENCPDEIGAMFVVAFDRASLMPTKLLTTPEQ